MGSGVHVVAAVSDMKPIEFPNARQIEAEACAWIARLDGGNPGQEDLNAFREWIRRSPRHRDQITRLSALWGDLNVLTELATPVESALGRSGRFWNRRLATAATLLVVVMVISGYFLWAPKQVVPMESAPIYATAIGERQSVTLSDGSKILLNTDSRLQVEYTPEEREVRLLKGEAYFEVAHNPARPFLVYAGSNVIRAVGTAFSVYVQTRDVRVVVTEGKVELSTITNEAPTTSTGAATTKTVDLAAINADQIAAIAEQVETIQTIPSAEVTRKLSWREGVLSFDGEPLEQVVQEVSRYTPVTIVISDPAIRKVAIGGYFKAGEIDAMFDALEASFGVRVTRVNDRLVYLAAK